MGDTMNKTLKYIFTFITCLMLSIIQIEAKSSGNDLFKLEEKVVVDKELDGTSFIAGDKVEINNTINGIGFIAGTDIKVNYKQKYMFGLGTKVNINEEIEKDLFLFASNINVNSNILRDAYLAGETININEKVDRNIYVYATEINIKGTINGNITIYSPTINIDKNAKILGTLKYNDDATINGLNEAIKTKTYKTTTTLTFKDYMTNFISTYIHIAILAITLVFISEKLLKKSLEQTKDITSKKFTIICGKGLLILIGIPIISIMLLFSGAFVSVGLISGIIYGILVYISNIFTAYFIANVLDKKYLKKNMNSYMLVIIGLFIIYVLKIIPIIGSLISFVSLSLGLGIIGNMIIEQKN